ncbi:MAG: bifunctional 5,10-methylenetetrahydrofolate dehydrogenase/5,10-methenyltetrahydrofolate cyclohydrolase [Firmicutes bacterium]|nr:bifunctional 5,10-methylenetetrahydrofolate dehydrogenase/5,10-methenyltetrahydrofolate cyclohydrolase [Bacillota bacterium]MBR0210090.1 bifunctional 5,10-methylenetetrahydrofolate dehydrogenase/5,10-methenyltetrahydrofolate cyclohydrolase [Bacillota bacterium]MBR0518114.1 bifunctional 5,10-methylenetetrahydrofolate dehydrogenase/5,10-methenyltetrahydrofolate cyclohydrolase [Bacillota bacterium]
MAEVLKGMPVAKAISEELKARSEALQAKGVTPTLAIFRVGERDDDLSYERGAMKRAEQTGVAVRNVVLPADVDSETFFEALDGLNHDNTVHGILMFRPLPKQLDGEKARQMLAPEKDVDGCTDGSLAGVFANAKVGFPPCTAQAAMEILKFYGIDPKGKKAAVIGRSLVIGRPVAMMLMHANATVTICHTRTVDVPSITKEADIVIAASGQMESVGAEYLSAGQTVIDVGIGWNEAKGKLCGDVKFEEAEPVVAAITPVPGGVGSVTTAVLCKHVIEAAERTL